MRICTYTGFTDKTQYFVFCNRSNYNLEIMRLPDKTIITNLKGHSEATDVLKYYFESKTGKEYLLSIDSNHLLIIWDLQNFDKKYEISLQYKGRTFGAMIAFNIFNKNYIITSSNEKKEYAKIYSFDDKPSFISNIFKTNDDITYSILLWFYNNKYFLIQLAKGNISINNLLEEEHYANLSKGGEEWNLSGFIYNKNYLVVSSECGCYIRIWDLIRKIIFKEFQISGWGYGIIPWNQKYCIVGSHSKFIIADLEKGKEEKSIEARVVRQERDNYGYIKYVKKIKINQQGESLLISDIDKNIRLYSI